uniref:A2 n=1 Tax=Arundo donax TaxID=35708 RepID=A0A0A9GQM8_ARUDO
MSKCRKCCPHMDQNSDIHELLGPFLDLI